MGSRHLPENYVEEGRWGLKQVTAADMLLATIFGLSVPTALLILGSLAGGPYDADLTISPGTSVTGAVLGVVMGVVLHESAHGACFLAFGGCPRFGFKPWTRLGPVFYAAAPGSYFTKLQYATSGLAPAVLLTVMLVVALALVAEHDLLAAVVAWALLLNVMGAAGDMLMMRKLVSYPRATRFEDTGDGFIAYGPANRLELR